jgi:predicted transposase YbfD/YdcC
LTRRRICPGKQRRNSPPACDDSTGFALAHNKQFLHMSLFARDAENNRKTPGSRMIRFSQRMRRRF